MLKRITALCLAASLFLLCGCSSMFQKEYLSVAEYAEEEHTESRLNAREVSSYDALKRILDEMVRNHLEEEHLQFSGYDGVIRDDLSRAIRELEEETALGSFAVEHISYDLMPIVTYYKATLYTSYKRTEAEIAALTYVSGQTRLSNFLDETLSALRPYAAFRMSSSDLSEAFFTDTVNAVFNANPASCVLRPELTVTLHPSTGTDRIIELQFNYGRTATVISNMRNELLPAIGQIVSGIQTAEPAAFALEAYNALAQRVSYDPDGEIRRGDSTLVPSIGGSVYGALVEGIANSAGIALAYSALCREAGMECFVVTGTLDKVEHSWNIINIDGAYYHVDVSADGTAGVTNAFGRSDAQMLSAYWWNIESFPECGESLNAADIFGAAP